MATDTNLVSALLQAIAARPPAAPNTGSTLLIVAMIIAALGPIISSITGFIQSRSIAETKKLASETAVVVDQVHTAVNSGHTAMMENFEKERAAWTHQLSELRNEVLRISKDLATAHEQKRGIEEKIKAPVAPVAAQAPPSLTAEQIAQIVAAFKPQQSQTQTDVANLVEVLKTAEPIMVKPVKGEKL